MATTTKIEIVNSLTQKFENSLAIYFTCYTGMNVIQATELRSLFKDSGVDFLDTTDEWSESLSDDDNDLLHDWLLENNYSVHVENDWPDEGIGFSVPDEESEYLEWLVDNNPDDGSWEGR